MKKCVNRLPVFIILAFKGKVVFFCADSDQFRISFYIFIVDRFVIDVTNPVLEPSLL